MATIVMAYVVMVYISMAYMFMACIGTRAESRHTAQATCLPDPKKGLCCTNARARVLSSHTSLHTHRDPMALLPLVPALQGTSKSQPIPNTQCHQSIRSGRHMRLAHKASRIEGRNLTQYCSRRASHVQAAHATKQKKIKQKTRHTPSHMPDRSPKGLCVTKCSQNPTEHSFLPLGHSYGLHGYDLYIYGL